MNLYDWLRAGHIICVIAWMSGMMYLPRLFAYHTETAPVGSEFDGHFKVWEGKLLKIIIRPAMTLTFLFGLGLIWFDGSQRLGWGFLLTPWMLTKIAGILVLGYWHGFLAQSYKKIAAGERPKTAKFWRATNELPFLAAVVMVIAVTTEFTFK